MRNIHRCLWLNISILSLVLSACSPQAGKPAATPTSVQTTATTAPIPIPTQTPSPTIAPQDRYARITINNLKQLEPVGEPIALDTNAIDLQAVSKIAITPDGSLLAVAVNGTDVYIWEVQSGAPGELLTTLLASACSLAFSPDSTQLLIGECLTNEMEMVRKVTAEGEPVDENLHLWEIASGTKLRSFKVKGGNGFIQAGFMPDGRIYSVTYRDFTYSSGQTMPHAVLFWDAATGEMTETNWGVGDPLVFSPDGGKHAFPERSGLTYILFNSSPYNYRRIPEGFAGYTLTFTPDSLGMATLGRERILRFADVISGKVIHDLPLEEAWEFNFPGDGRQLLWIDSGLHVHGLAVQDATPPGSGEFSQHRSLPYGSRPLELDWSPDSRYLGVTGENLVDIWDIESGEKVTSFEGQELAWSPSANTVAIGQFSQKTGDTVISGKVRVLDLPTAEELFILDLGFALSPHHISWSPNGYQLAITRSDGQVFIWVPNSQDIEWDDHELQGATENGDIISTAWSPDSHNLAVSGMEKTMVFNLGAQGYPVLKTVQGFDSSWLDETQLCTISSQLMLLDVETQAATILTDLGSDKFIFDDQAIDAEAGLVAVGLGENVRVWQASTLDQFTDLTEPGYDAAKVDISPNGRYLATVSAAGDVVIWSTGR